MFKILLILLLTFLVACSDTRSKSAQTVTPKSAITIPPAKLRSFTDLWHLKHMPALGGGRAFSPNEVTLQFDTSAKKLTVDGKLNRIFTPKGVYKYDIRDTAIYNRNIYGGYFSNEKYIKLNGIYDGTIFYSFNSLENQIMLQWDLDTNYVDEERYYIFRQ